MKRRDRTNFVTGHRLHRVGFGHADVPGANGFFQIDLRNNITIEATGEPGTFSLYKDPGLTQLVDSITNDGRGVHLFEHHVKLGKTYIYYVTFTDIFNRVFGPTQIVVSD